VCQWGDPAGNLLMTDAILAVMQTGITFMFAFRIVNNCLTPATERAF
jgi:hypothetical protein